MSPTTTHTLGKKKKKKRERGITPHPSQRTEEDDFWLVSSLLSLCGHLRPSQEFSISIVCFYHSTHSKCRVRKEQMPDYSCLGQTNGCGPSCPSSHSFVFIRGTVNIDDQNPFRIKMPNVYNHSLALTELLVGNSMSRMA